MKMFLEAIYLIIFIIMCLLVIPTTFWVFHYLDRSSHDNIRIEKYKVIVVDEIYSSERNIGKAANYHDAFYLRVKDSLGRENRISSSMCSDARKNDTLILSVEVSDARKDGNKIFNVKELKKLNNGNSK
jgi:hypothetical protein